MSDLWPNESLHQVYLCKHMCWKKVLILHGSLLQLSCGRSLPLSFTSAPLSWAITPFHIPAPCALKSPNRIVKQLAITFRRASLLFSTYSWYRALEFEPYVGIKRREQGKLAVCTWLSSLPLLYASCCLEDVDRSLWSNHALSLLLWWENLQTSHLYN